MAILTLRPYQQKMNEGIMSAWASALRFVLSVLPTGAGKTVTFGKVVSEHSGAACVIAHRQELVSQISLALAKFGVRHSIMAPRATVRWIIQYHIQELGASFFDPDSPVAVAGVNTLLRRAGSMGAWCNNVTLWVIDEAHHVLQDNQWGKAVALFPNARGLGVTATPLRADGRGLGACADGVFDTMLVGPTMRDLINQEHLCDYRVFAPPSDLDLGGVKITRSGDYSPKQLTARVRESHIVGDIVEQYIKIAPGELGVTFVSDVATAGDVATKFNASGVPAEVVSAKTPDAVRVDILRRFKRGDLKELVNVALFDEGFDLPALQVVSMGAATESYGRYCQQFGRVVRRMEGKPHGTIIDHVGNVMRHGLPDAPREWTLEARERGSRGKRDPDVIPTQTCKECTAVFEAIYKICPFCDAPILPVERRSPKHVDGDLTELDPATLADLRGEVARIDAPPEQVRTRMEHAGAPGAAIGGAVKNHRLRQESQVALRSVIAYWAGAQRQQGRPDFESYRRFYWQFGVDVMTAQTLGRRDADELTKRILKKCCN